MKTAYGFGTHVLDKSALYQAHLFAISPCCGQSLAGPAEQSEALAGMITRKSNHKGLLFLIQERSVKPAPVAQYTSMPG